MGTAVVQNEVDIDMYCSFSDKLAILEGKLCSMDSTLTDRIGDANNFSALGDLLSQCSALEVRMTSIESNNASAPLPCNIEDLEDKLDKLWQHSQRVSNETAKPEEQGLPFGGPGAIPGALERLVRRTVSMEQRAQSFERTSSIHSKGVSDALHRLQKLEDVSSKALPGDRHAFVEQISKIQRQVELALASSSPEHISNMITKSIEASIPTSQGF